jgi:chloramphenicol-sensitive protein RarD
LASNTSSEASSDLRHVRGGFAAGLVAYTLWGFLPLLFKLVEHVGAVGVVAERTFWSLIVVGVGLLVTGRFREVRAAFSNPATLRSMVISSLLLGGNWLIYVTAVETNQVLESTFGYFINPMMSVAIGMVFLGERQNRAQAVAICIALVAIVIQAIGLGHIPYIALSLATTFAAYGYARKTAKVNSTAGLFAETLILAPFAVGYLVYGLLTSGLGAHADLQTSLLLVLTGPATAAPLILFAFAVQRLRLTTMGMLQYIAPSIAFVLAITVFGEQLNPLRIVSFALIWLSLAVFTLGSMGRQPAPLD